ncbi:hypothetical protein PIROE2DRAFT_19017, partial [Piromyces sp. E2]
QKSFEALFAENDILRTKYNSKEINGKTEIYGIVDDECELKFEEYTYENANSFVRPFELSSAPLIRVGFIGNEVLMFDMHHIITDGFTTKVIINEINKYYNEGKFNENEIQFSDYAIYLNEKLNSGYYQNQIEFYKEMFNNEYETLNIQTKNKKEKIEMETKNGVNISTYSSIIDENLSNSINKFIKQNEVSKVAFFISIYGYILSKYSGQETIYSSIISANRNNRYLENMIGMFVSTQPLLLKYEKTDKHSFVKVIKENMSLLLGMYSNQDLSLSELTKSLKLKKLNNIFIYQPKSIVNSSSSNNNSIIENDTQNEEVLSLFEDNSSKFDIAFNLIEKENEYLVSIDYNNNIYDSKLIERILNSYLEMIGNIEDFENKLCEIEYIPKKEKEIIINSFNNNCTEYKQDKLYHTEFSKLAKEIPEKCAIVYEGKEISYKKLDEMSNSIAHFLRKQGVKRGEVIPIISERSYYYVIGIIGIMKSGGAYLPIDPDFPKDRIQYMIEEVNATRVLKYITDEKNNEKMKIVNKSVEVFSLEQHDYSKNIEEIENINESDDLCYILFTSGTTGKPKGTMIAHSNLINYCLYCKEYMHKQGFKSYLSFSKFTFDMSIDEINFPLLRGSKIVLCNDEEFNNPMKIAKLIKIHDIGSLLIVPSRFENYMNNDEFYESIKNIKHIVFGGEKLSAKLLENIYEHFNLTVYNGYGPTETTASCTYKKILPDEIKDGNKELMISIGKPLCNCKMYILDENMKPVPIGVEGEIFIGGYGVGKGYLNRPELTQEKFIINPFIESEINSGNVMYRTGDLGKWTEEGEIICLGRIDFQVKIRGQRIELSEIENTINEIEGIKESIVFNMEKENKEQYLVAYYIKNSKIVNGNQIRNYLKEKLPYYMIPTYFIKINEIPVTNNGKLNRKALPEPSINDMIKEEYIAPETDIEKEICNIYSQIFKIDVNEIGKNSNFFDLGGD